MATERAITNLFMQQRRPPKTGYDEFSDRATPSLYLRHYATGDWSWRFFYRVAGKQKVATLRAADPAAARKWAAELREAARNGLDPVAKEREEKDAARANTVLAVAALYLANPARSRKGGQLRPKSVANYRQMLEHDILPVWGSRPLASIGKVDIEALLYTKKSTPSQADHVYVTLRTFFGWSREHGYITDDPLKNVARPGAGPDREHYLSDAELRALWEATETLDGRVVLWGRIIRVMLLTAAREGEVSGMRWSEIDTEKRVWNIPASRAKNRRSHLIHLSNFAWAQLPPRGNRDLIFGRMVPKTFSDPKHKLDGKMAAILGHPPAHWVLHDLRRTAVTKMAENLEIDPVVIDKIINHASGVVSGVMAIYQRAEFLGKRKAALEAWANYVAGLVEDGGGSNIVALRR